MSERIRKVNSSRPNPTGTSQLMRSIKSSMRPLDEIDDSETSAKFRDIKIEDLQPYEDNDNVFGVDQSQVDAMAEDIKKNGFHGAITVSKLPDGKYRILSGHQRVLAAQKAGLTSVPANIDDNLDQTHQFEVWMKSNALSRKQTPYRYYAMCAKAKQFIEERKRVGDPDFQDETRPLIAKLTNLSETQVGRYMRFANLPPYTLKCCDSTTFPYTVVLKVAGFDQVKKEAFDHDLEKYVKSREESGLEIETSDLKQLIAKVEKGKSDYFEGDEPEPPKRNRRGKFYELPEDAQQLYYESYDSLKEEADKYKKEHKDDTPVIDDEVAEMGVKLSCLTSENTSGVSDPKKLSAAIKMLEESVKKLKSIKGVYEF